MAIYVALLRGINVGGNTLKMERLRALCGELRFTNVRTYMQSGNVIFESSESAASCVKTLEEKLVGESRLPVSVILRTPKDLENVLKSNPFLKEKAIDETRLYVTFLPKAAPKEGVQKIGLIKAGSDRFEVVGKEIFLHCPDGYGETKLSNTAIEKALGLRTTTRNWNTVNKLLEMAKQ